MKFLAILLIASSASAAWAFPNEVQCDGLTREGARARVEVERSFGGGMRDALVTVYGARGTNPSQTRYHVYQTRRWGQQLEYWGSAGFRLEVDLFGEQRPQWGRSYFGRLNGMRTLRCRFMN